MIERTALSLHYLVPEAGDLLGLVALGKDCSDLQTPPILLLPTAHSITQFLLLSVWLIITLLHMICVKCSLPGMTGVLEENKICIKLIQNLNVKGYLQLHAQVLHGCEQLDSISLDLVR